MNPDLRLPLAAAAVWLGSASGLLGVERRWGSTAVLLGVVGAAGLVLAASRRQRLALVCVALGVAAAAVAGLRADRAHPQAVQALVDRAGVVEVEVVLRSDPVVRTRSGFGGESREEQWSARVTIRQVRDGDLRWEVGIPAVMRWAPEQGAPKVGERVRLYALLHPDSLLQQRTYRVAPRSRITVVAPAAVPVRLAAHVRSGLARATGAMDDGGRVNPAARPGAALLPGLVLGDTRAQDERLTQALRDSGLAHLTAVSGANVAIVLGVLLHLLGRTRVPLRRRYALGAVLVGSYLYIVGWQPSVVRASGMALISLYALAVGDRRRGDAVLWTATAVLLFIDPFLATSWGFALSVAATGGLVVLQPRLRPHLRLRPRWLADALLVTLCAQLATLPLLIAMGAPPTLVAVPANLFAEPLVLPATVLGVVATVVAALGLLPLARLLAFPAAVAAEGITRIAFAAADSALAVAPITTIGGLIAVLVAGVAVVVVRWLPLRVVAVVLVVCLAGWSYRSQHRPWVATQWWYAQCDVGQGDATVIRVAEHSAVVIDTGPDAPAMRRCLRSLAVSHVPVLVLTHFHADHVGGIAGVRAAATIDRVFANAYEQPAGEAAWAKRQLADVPVEVAAPGLVFTVGDTRVQVHQAVASGADDNPNNASLVIEVRGPRGSALVTGDLEPEGQADLRGRIAPVDVLKVPHHASRAQDAQFLRELTPAIAVISVGADNDYGHPSEQTVTLLRSGGAVVLRTDTHGGVTIAARPRLGYATGMAG